MRNFIFVIIMVIAFASFCQAEENVKREKSSMSVSWRYLNSFDADKYCERLTQCVDAVRMGNSVKIAEIFGFASNKMAGSEISFYADGVSLQNMNGYTGERISISLLDKKFARGWNISILKEEWREDLDTTIYDIAHVTNGKRPESGIFYVFMKIYKDSDIARTDVFQDKPFFGNMPTEHYFRWYKADKGPGDACLLHVSARNGYEYTSINPKAEKLELSDREMFFIRGNVSVFLFSSYKHIGCWDLACKIDAALVEQMKKKEREKPPEQKTGNDEKNNGKTE